MELKEKAIDGTTVIDIHAGESPKKSWRQWLIGRPLANADAPHQTIWL